MFERLVPQSRYAVIQLSRKKRSCAIRGWEPVRSTFPFGIKGNASKTTNEDGIMYSGNFSFRYLRSSVTESVESSLGTT